MLPKTKIELIVLDDAVEEVVQSIIETSQTGSIGDGKIFVSDILDVYRVRTGEQGDTAI
jgi:nitrogen regulatory protein P-II 1